MLIHLCLFSLTTAASPARERLPAAFWSASGLADARHQYVEEGARSALALYARGLTESLAHADLASFGRDQDLFGPAEGSNFDQLPALIFGADDKTRVMNVLLTMIDLALPGGLHVVRRFGEVDDEWRARVLGPRLHQLNAVLRQIRDTPAFVRAGAGSGDPDLIALTRALSPVIEQIIHLNKDWRILDDAGDPVPRAMLDRFVSLGTDALAVVASSTYVGLARIGCRRDL